MATRLSTKLAALGIALIVNCMMIGGVAFLFSGQIHRTAEAAPFGIVGAMAAAPKI